MLDYYGSGTVYVGGVALTGSFYEAACREACGATDECCGSEFPPSGHANLLSCVQCCMVRLRGTGLNECLTDANIG